MMALGNDMIGYVCSNTGPLMAPYGGREKMIGNNPLSYAFPANRCTPVVVDFSCSVVSAGRIQLQRKKGEKIPLGWAIDRNGLPTEDPFDGTEGGGTLSPVGAHKGYGLALAHEISSALLTGGKWSSDIIGLFRPDENGIQGTCHSFMVIDPDCFVGRDVFKRRMDDYINAVKNSGKAKGVEEIFMPGEIEARAEAERRKNGIPLPRSTAHGLMELAERLNLSFP
jgi:LDH2 family malate/lactate/ureidoglycolate dehydrogenase